MKKALKKACKHKKHLLAKQTVHPNIQPATKLGPITAMSPPVLSNTATSALATSTVKTVAELDAKLLCMEQRWAQTSTSPLPEGIRNAIMDLRAALVIQEVVVIQPVEVPAYNVQVSRNREKQGNVKRGKMSEKEMESTERRGEEQEKESTKEEKIEEVHTIQGHTNMSSQNPTDNERTIMPTASPQSTHALMLPKHLTVSSIVDMVHTTARTAANEGVQIVGNDAMCLAPSFFDWADDVDATVAPTPIALVAPVTRIPRDFTVLCLSNRNPWSSLSQHHHCSQPRICNSFDFYKYNTNYAYKPATPSPAPAPVQLIETVQNPCGIVPTKPVIRTMSPSTSTPIIHPSSSTPSCEPLSGVCLDSTLQPLGALLLDWSGDPLLAGLARILKALGWI